MFLNIHQKDEKAIAVIDHHGFELSYGELCSKAKEFGFQIKERQLVFCLCENELGALIGYIGCMSNKTVPLLLSGKLDKSLLETLIGTYQPAYLWMPNEFSCEFSYEKTYCDFGYALLKTGYENIEVYEELGLLLTTSGSTGSPKLVRQSYRNLYSNAESIAEYLELDQTERPITTLPMSYTYGLSIIHSHLLVGATILLTSLSYTQKSFWDFFHKEGATSFGGVPYTYEILKRLKFFKMELPSLKTMTQAGGKLSLELHKEFAEYARTNGKRFFVMYGQTEATARMSYLPHERSVEKYGSIGIAIPGGQFTLIDEDQKIITQPDVVGELVYEGSNVTLGYAQCLEDLKKGDECKGILVTGDLAKMDDDGYYYIVGRKKRFLKIFGNRINLDECERLIKNQFAELDCACIGVDDKMQIYITDNDLKEKVKKYISEKLGLHASAFDVKYLGTIPKNESGKTLYNSIAGY